MGREGGEVREVVRIVDRMELLLFGYGGGTIGGGGELTSYLTATS